MRLSARAIIIENNALLLIEFDDENGLHYNFPGGGQEDGESLAETVIREVMEEANAELAVGPLMFVYEYAPHLCDARYGPKPTISFLFWCSLKEGSQPAMPDKPDPNQTGVKWVPLDRLDEIVLLPNLGERVRKFYQSEEQPPVYVGEHELEAT